MMEALRSSETPVLTRATRPNIPEDGMMGLAYNECDKFFKNLKAIGG
jgi:hypothetical protein